MATNEPMRIKLSEDARRDLVAVTQHFFVNELDQELSEFQCERLIAFFIRNLGAPVYNQAIRDARGFLLEKLEGLEGDFYEPEEPR